jgi:hypothetical protein
METRKKTEETVKHKLENERKLQQVTPFLLN